DPGLLGLGGDLHGGAAVGHGVADDGADGGPRLAHVVGDVGDVVRALGELDDEGVGEAVDVGAMQGPHPAGPALAETDTASADRVYPGPGRELGADLEPSGPHDAVDLVLPAAGDHAGFVERLQVLVVEAGALAQLPVPGLQRVSRRAVVDDGLDPGPDLLHLLEVGVFEGVEQRVDAELATRGHALEQLGLHPPGDVGPAVLDQILVAGGAEPAHGVGGEVLQPPLLPARLGDGREPVGVRGFVATHVDRRRGALEHVQLPGVAGQVRDALHGSRARADDGDSLVGQVAHRLPVGTAAGVAVVPAAGVERVPTEAVDAGDVGDFGDVQRAGAETDELAREPVAPVGA